MKVGLIWAMADNGVIGRDGGLPWKLPNDLKHFKEVTMGNPVIMGRKTFASLGKPLPGRLNLVLSRSGLALAGATTLRSLDEALAAAEASGARWAWVIGGAEVYAAALARADCLQVTRVHGKVEGDVVFPSVDWEQWECLLRERHPADAKHAMAYTFESWVPDAARRRD